MKTFLLHVTLLLVIQISLSGCYEIPNIFGGYGASSPWDDDFDFYYFPSFSLDSIVQTNDSEVVISAHIRYDSVMIIKNRTIHYSYFSSPGDTEVFVEVVQSIPDTINFSELADSAVNWQGRMEGIYKYTLTVDSLKSGVEYSMCINSDFVEKTESTSGICSSVKLR